MQNECVSISHSETMAVGEGYQTSCDPVEVHHGNQREFREGGEPILAGQESEAQANQQEEKREAEIRHVATGANDDQKDAQIESGEVDRDPSDEQHQEELPLEKAPTKWNTQVDTSPEGFHPYGTEPHQVQQPESTSPFPVFSGDAQAASSRDHHEQDRQSKKREAKKYPELEAAERLIGKFITKRSNDR